MNRRFLSRYISFLFCCFLCAGAVSAQAPTSAYSVTSSMPDMDGFYTFNNQNFNGKPVFKHVTKNYFLYYGSYAGLWMEWQLGARVADWDAPWSCCYYFSNNNVTGNYNDVSALGAMATVQESSLLAVKFLSFEASASANFAMLQWSVADARD
ncbi:MAG: hypothetical protein H7Y27_16645, partial [Gemmatimonadaceae bacterium]|nr:hypothetical protein [Chitinophagaceae bacterium]